LRHCCKRFLISRLYASFRPSPLRVSLHSRKSRPPVLLPQLGDALAFSANAEGGCSRRAWHLHHYTRQSSRLTAAVIRPCNVRVETRPPAASTAAVTRTAIATAATTQRTAHKSRENFDLFSFPGASKENRPPLSPATITAKVSVECDRAPPLCPCS